MGQTEVWVSHQMGKALVQPKKGSQMQEWIQSQKESRKQEWVLMQVAIQTQIALWAQPNFQGKLKALNGLMLIPLLIDPCVPCHEIHPLADQ